MSKNLITGIVLAGALIVCGIGWLLVSASQDPRRAVDAQASTQLERARRLFHKYDASLTYKSLLIGQLGERGIEVEPEDLSETTADEYQQTHAAMWEAYQPSDWQGDRVRPARASYGNLTRQIRNGLSGQAKLLGENDGLLKQALTAVDQALLFTHGSESSQSHAEANRLKGVILYQMGVAKQVEAQLRRREGDSYRRELIALAASAAESKSAETLVPDSNIDEHISRLQDKGLEIDAAVTEDRKALAALAAKIDELEARLLTARSQRDEARKAMERLRAEGIDFSDPDGAESFRTRLEEQDRIYRNAAREAHAAEYGSTTDLTVQYGLLHYRNERTVLAAKIEGRQGALDNLRSDVARLRGVKSTYQTAQTRAAQRIAEVASVASNAYAELNRVDSEAFAIEESALEGLEKSARTSQQAAGYADRWVSDARDRTEGLSSEAQRRSAYNDRLRDEWMSGYTAAQAADARVAKAWVHYQRYHTYTQNAELLAEVTRLGGLRLNEADVESERVKAKEAHDAGVEEIKQAMEILQRAHRKAGRHWTVVAQAAGTTYLLALFGHEDYADDAIEAYRNAVKGREDEEYARTFVARLNRLEGQR